MKKLILFVAFCALGSLASVEAQEKVCESSCENEKYYALAESSSGEMCCILTTNELAKCTGEKC